MKKISLSLAALLISAFSFSQSFDLGLKAGVSSSKLKYEDNAAALEGGDLSLGYHVGAFARVGILGFFVQPEVYFNNAGGKVIQPDPNNPQATQEVDFDMSKVDVPVLIGYKFFIARVYVGPVASFLTSAKYDGADVKDQYKSSIYGYQAGAGLDISKLTIDVRYEGQFGSISDVANYKNNVNQVMLSLGWKLL